MLVIEGDHVRPPDLSQHPGRTVNARGFTASLSRAVIGSMLAVAVAAGVALAPAQAAAGGSTLVSGHLRALVRGLVVASPSHQASYDRSLFGEWTEHSTRYGYCNTRALVLIEESLKPTTRTRSCTVITGRWFSFYDARYYTYAYGGHLLQIDHMVPVENAWQSGAWRWSHARRVAFYNDLGDGRSLNAVDARDNLAKGDRSPDQWLPSHGRCRYVRDWTAVKIRWRLSATSAEKRALIRLANGCPDTWMTIRQPNIN